MIKTVLYKNICKDACSFYHSVAEKPMRKEQVNANKIDKTSVLCLYL